LIAAAAVIAVAAVIGLLNLRPDRNLDPSAGSAPSASPTSVSDDASAAPSATSTATAAAPTTSPASAPPTSAVPSGFRRYRDPTGFSVAVPAGWTRSKKGSSVFFSDPAGRGYLQIDQTEKPKADVLADWRKQESSASRRFPGYQRIRLERVDYRSWDAADWEFTWRASGGALHVLNRNVRVSDKRAYALLWSIPAQQWQQRRSTFSTIAGSFQPAP
jgi:hypothetical protein